MVSEIEISEGKLWVQLMWDISAFYDSIALPETLQRLEETQAPRVPTTMALMAHKAPRWLKMNDSFSDMAPRTALSILVGCSSSTSLARAYMQRVAATTLDYRGVLTNQHVNDLSHGFGADTEDGPAEGPADGEPGGAVDRLLQLLAGEHGLLPYL